MKYKKVSNILPHLVAGGMLPLLVLVGLLPPVLAGVITRLKRKANGRESGLQLALLAKRRAAPNL